MTFSIGNCVAYTLSVLVHGKKTTLLWPVSGRTCFRIAFHIICTVNAHYFNFFVPLAQDSRERILNLSVASTSVRKMKIAAAIKLQKAAIDQTAYITLTGTSGCHMFDAREWKTPRSRPELAQSDRFFSISRARRQLCPFCHHIRLFSLNHYWFQIVLTHSHWGGLVLKIFVLSQRTYRLHTDATTHIFVFMQNIFAVRSPATDLERRVRPQCFACSWHACPTRLKSLLNSEECKNHTRPKPNGCAPPASQFIFFSFPCWIFYSS